MSDEAIHIEGARFSYDGGVEALAGASLSIRAGERVCILGGNGSGKSTLLQLMNALLLPDSGTVRVLGLDPSEPGRALDIRHQVATVFQHPEDQMVTSVVADDVAFGPENLGVAPADIARRVDAALKAVDMAEFALADPANLSGGQKQRVAIAGALAMEPRVLLLDEPAAMLDDEGRRKIQGIIARLSEQGITIVHVTHFMDDALAADRVVVMDAGRVALDGTPEEVFSQTELVERLGLELPFVYRLERAMAATSLERSPGLGRPLSTRVAASPLPNGQPKPELQSGGLDPQPYPGPPSSSSSNPGAGAVRAGRECCASAGSDVLAGACAALLPARTAPAPGLLEEQVNEVALAFRDVTFSYARGASPAIDGLSFSLAPGTLTALVGRTGSGKSTTAELACALKMPQAGRVEIAGIDSADLKRRRELRSRVGYVSQLPERQLFAPTVFDDIAFGPRNLGLPEDEVRARVLGALEAVGLAASDSLLARSPFALSGGQQRSVALAGILAMRQPILVLDEPMAGLDPAGRERVRRILLDLKRAGTALLLVTHSMDDAAELADRVIALGRGRKAADGTPDEVFAQRELVEELGLGLPLKYRDKAGEGDAQQEKGPGSGRALDKGFAVTSYPCARPEPGLESGGVAAATPTAPSPIHRLDPRVKLVATVIYMVSCFFISNAAMLAAAAIAVVAAILAAKVPLGRLVSQIKPVLLFLVITSVFNLFFVQTGDVAVELGFVHIYEGGLAAAALYTLRFFLLLLAGGLLMLTTTPTALCDAFEQVLKPLQKFGAPVTQAALILSIALRFVPILAQEADNVIAAQTARGADLEGKSALAYARACVPLIVPLFASALRHAENLGRAMDARCYTGGTGRTHYHELRLDARRDAPFIAAATTYLALLVALA